MPHSLFLGLDTYSKFGGLQAFNRRLISCLAERSAANHEGEPIVVLKRDKGASLPPNIRAKIILCSNKASDFASNALRSAIGANLIVVGHINLLPVAALCKLLAPRAPIVLMVHGDEVWGDPVYRAPRFVDRPLLAMVSRVVSVSQFTISKMQATYSLPPEKFRVFLNAVDPIDFPPRTNEALPEVLSVTRLASHDHGKNIDKVLEAVARLIPTRPELHYTIIGDGVLRPELEATASRLGLGKHVTFAGRVTDQDLKTAYERASVFILPSAKEGFGIVFLEAWQHRIPVICGTEDAAHQIISHGQDGFAVNPKDIAGLADKITWLLDNPDEARRMGEAGRSKVDHTYLMANYKARLNDILDEVLSKK